MALAYTAGTAATPGTPAWLYPCDAATAGGAGAGVEPGGGA